MIFQFAGFFYLPDSISRFQTSFFDLFCKNILCFHSVDLHFFQEEKGHLHSHFLKMKLTIQDAGAKPKAEQEEKEQDSYLRNMVGDRYLNIAFMELRRI